MSKSLPIYQIDAFAKEPFSGNPAAVCPLDEWLTDEEMQAIAEENNLAETAFLVKEPDGFRIRWFTPAVEVELCGHATLATGYVLFEELGHKDGTIEFNCLSGKISVTKSADLYTLNFPLDAIETVTCPEALKKSLGLTPIKAYKGKTDYLLIYSTQDEIEALAPDFSMMSQVEGRGCIVSAPGKDFDVVCRGFFPQSGINEDPATGSAQTTIAAYWPEVIKKNKYTACQWSLRKGYFNTEVKDNRVLISGECRKYMEGKIFI